MEKQHHVTTDLSVGEMVWVARRPEDGGNMPLAVEAEILHLYGKRFPQGQDVQLQLSAYGRPILDGDSRCLFKVQQDAINAASQSK